MGSPIVYVAGARPNFIKLAPVMASMRRALPEVRHVFVNTGQHYDHEMAEIFLEELGLPTPDYSLNVGSGSHGVQTARCLERIEAVLEAERPSLVVVPGDINSTLAASLAAAKLEIPIAHIESGLRSFDRSMPEEINRVVTDQLASWCFTHSPEAGINLAAEGVADDRIFFVGNTMIDTLVLMRSRIDASTITQRLGLQRGGYVLATLHRPGLVDGPLLQEVMQSLERLSNWLPVVFPVHPRTRSRLGVRYEPGRQLRLLDPIGYVDFVALEANAAAIVTDSGGVQEESTYLGVPCYTLRENTERPVTIDHGTNQLVGLEVSAVEQIPNLVARTASARVPALWDGQAATRVALILQSHFENAPVGIPGVGEPDEIVESVVS